jgi:DUF4097 and DUF4098 domain-containing protein YvlB
MKNTALALLVLLLVSGPAAAQGKETETVDKTLALSGGGTLKLNNFSGNVHITGTADSSVQIHAVRRATRERLDNILLDIQVSGSTIEIEANRKAPGWHERNDNVVETEFDIKVPAATLLDVHTFSGDVIAKGTTQDVKAQTFSGNIDIDLSTAGAAPDVKAETFSGDISTRLSAASNGHVTFNSFSGDFRSDFPVMLNRKSRRDISADLGSGGAANFDFKTFSGDLKLVK